MRGLPAAADCLVVVLVLAGCAAPGGKGAAGDVGNSGTVLGEALAPQVIDWTGHVLASEVDNSTHFRPTEDALWPAYQSGFLFEVDELPQAMEVALDWEGSGRLMIMLHSHKDHGTNVYVEHVSKKDYENPKCVRVPTVDLAHGTWQVMVHSDEAMQTDFTLRVGLVGGAGHVIEGERHGHWYQDGQFDVDKHAIEPCQVLHHAPEDADATAPAQLPSETHFEFGESWGCGWPMNASAGPACLEFQAGPGGTGASVDGHWMELGQPYWGLLMTSTIDQAGVLNDLDCLFTDAEGDIVGDASNGPGPCLGLVPEGAQWVFAFPYTVGALRVTVDFALPTADGQP
jgi:hypothetical protein